MIQRHSIQFREITPEGVRRIAGKPHPQCIREIFTGLSEDEIKLLTVETAREDVRVVAELGGTIYEDVGPVLHRLRARFPLFIVSNCQSGYVEAFLKVSRFEGIFKDFECWGNTGQSKSANLRSLVQRNGLQYPIFVGDGEGDRLAAKDCGIPFVFAAYGFGSCSEWTFKVETFSDLERSLSNQDGVSSDG